MTVSKTQFREAMFAERDKTDQPWPDQGLNKYIEAASIIGLDDPSKLTNPAIRSIDPHVGSAEYIPPIIKTGKIVLQRLLIEDEQKQAKKFEKSLPDTLLETFDSAESDFKDLVHSLKSETALAVHKLINDNFVEFNQLKSQSISSKDKEITELRREVEAASFSLEKTKEPLNEVTEGAIKSESALKQAEEQIRELQAELNTFSTIEKELATLKGKVSAYEAMLEPKAPSRTRNNRAQS
jgi:chromosome segregation ATPase